MVISKEILFGQGAAVKTYAKDEFIFNQGNLSKYYFQIEEGIVKINNLFENGKEFIHGFPFKGHCFGESYLLTDKPYAVNAVAVTDCTIIKLDKHSYLNLVLKNPHLFLKVNTYTAERLHFRYLISSFLAISDSAIRVQKFLEHLKDYFGYEEKYSFLVPFTKSELASLTGLRVETVIKSLKEMASGGLVKINNSKLYL